MWGVRDRARHLILQTGFADRLYKQGVTARGKRVAAEVHRVQSGGEVVQRHEIFPVGADVRRVVIDGVLLAGYFPVQRI